MDQEKLIHSLKLQLRIERTAILLLTLILLGRWAYGNFHTRYFAIYVNNKPVACLATREAADQVITQVKSAVAGAKASQVSFKENVKIKRAPRDAKTQSEKEAIKSVLGKVSLRVVKWAILLDGIPVVAVDSEEQAGDVLESAKERFGSMVENLMEEPHFKEQVTAEEMPVDLAIYRPKTEEALDLLVLGGGPEGGVYVVQSGDVASRIAARHNMSLTELEELNPGKNLARLQIGEEVRVSNTNNSSKRSLTVVVRDQISRTEPIPYRTESISSVQLPAGRERELSPGRNGLRHVVVAVTYENGIRTGEEIVEETIIREAVPRRVAVGISPR